MAEAQDRSSGWIGTVLADKWRIDAKIARGGVATVYRATHRQGQLAAIKIMHPELARNEEVRKRFLREGYAANKVGHPGVVSVLDDDVTKDGSAYIVMELLEQGEVLEDRRERLGGKLPVAEAVDIGKQILDVLAVAHEKGIIHRDIKPENIFVLSDGTVKVLDFGIAHIKEAAKQHEATATGLLLGTPEYMSPEQVLGKRGQIDASTDIYAVGATLFTLLSGESVHVADTLNMLLVQAASRQARSLSSVAYKEIPRALITVVDKALALEKPRRWPSARAMQLALGEAVPAPVARASAPKAKLPPPAAPPPRAVTLPPAPPRPAATESVPPPSLPPLSGPTTVIPRREENAPWTDEMGADDLDAPTVATTGGPIGGAPAPSVRSEVLARSARPSAPPRVEALASLACARLRRVDAAASYRRANGAREGARRTLGARPGADGARPVGGSRHASLRGAAAARSRKREAFVPPCSASAHLVGPLGRAARGAVGAVGAGGSGRAFRPAAVEDAARPHAPDDQRRDDSASAEARAARAGRPRGHRRGRLAARLDLGRKLPLAAVELIAREATTQLPR